MHYILATDGWSDNRKAVLLQNLSSNLQLPITDAKGPYDPEVMSKPHITYGRFGQDAVFINKITKLKSGDVEGLTKLADEIFETISAVPEEELV